MANPAKSFAEKADPFLYTKVSGSNTENLTIVSVTLYASGNVELPTTVYLPSAALRKIGMDHPKGWDYEARTVNAPRYTSRNEGARSIVTEIDIVALPNARETNLVVLDIQNRVFLLHLVPRPKMIGKTPFYSPNVTWWPPYGSFPSEGLRPLEKTTGSIPASLPQRKKENR